LLWLEALILRYLEKQVDSPEGKSWVSYPLPAIREALVNAVYHRSYEDSVEPIKVFLYPNRVEIISYPGPVDGIELEHLTGLRPLPPVPARNRRIGEFLKELKLSEGRGTGLPKIFRSLHENGSPPPVFDFDPYHPACTP
jgi:ATP-dependent DNA helicase RecG